MLKQVKQTSKFLLSFFFEKKICFSFTCYSDQLPIDVETGKANKHIFIELFFLKKHFVLALHVTQINYQ
jgi:hypothetical protein